MAGSSETSTSSRTVCPFTVTSTQYKPSSVTSILEAVLPVLHRYAAPQRGDANVIFYPAQNVVSGPSEIGLPGGVFSSGAPLLPNTAMIVTDPEKLTVSDPNVVPFSGKSTLVRKRILSEASSSMSAEKEFD